MTENITMGDVLQMHDTSCTKGAGMTLSTVLGIIGAIIVLALLWNSYTTSRDKRANTEALTSGVLGNLTTAVNGTQEEVRLLAKNERQDALKLAFNDGLYGHGYWPNQGYGHGYGYGHCGPGFGGFGYGYGHGHGCCGHGDHHHDCGPKQQFREVRTFNEASDNIEVISTCGSLRG